MNQQPAPENAEKSDNEAGLASSKGHIDSAPQLAVDDTMRLVGAPPNVGGQSVADGDVAGTRGATAAIKRQRGRVVSKANERTPPPATVEGMGNQRNVQAQHGESVEQKTTLVSFMTVDHQQLTGTNLDATLTQCVQQLNSVIHASLQPGLDESIQDELAKIVTLLPDIRPLRDIQLLQELAIAVKALLIDEEHPDVKLAQEIRNSVEQRIKRFTFPPSMWIVLGMFTFLYAAIPLLILLAPYVAPQQIGPGYLDIHTLLVMGVAGAIGSIVSIMVRLQDFTDRTVDRRVLVLAGFFKPIIGMAFAIFVYSVFKSGLIPITIGESQQSFFFVALSFVSGFSERFAQIIATRVEDIAGTDGTGISSQQASTVQSTAILQKSRKTIPAQRSF